MGIDIATTSFAQLWSLVAKRVVYLIAKLISFKGLAFAVACFYMQQGTISDVVWCGMILGIITNRVIQAKQKGDAGYETEKDLESAGSAAGTDYAFDVRPCTGRKAPATGAVYAARSAAEHGKQKLASLAAGDGSVQGD